jgi:hypothetical protein
VQADEYGDAGLVFWSVLVYAVFAALVYIALKTAHRVGAGLLAVASVFAFSVLVGALFSWFGWWPDDFPAAFERFDLALLTFERLTLIAAVVAWRINRFPLLVFLVAVSAWYFVTDFVSNGGDWSAVVTMLVGIVLFATAGAADGGESLVSGFWLHVASGLAIGGGLLWFFHDGDVDWIVAGLAGLAYIAIGDRLARSSKDSSRSFSSSSLSRVSRALGGASMGWAARLRGLRAPLLPTRALLGTPQPERHAGRGARLARL